MSKVPTLRETQATCGGVTSDGCSTSIWNWCAFHDCGQGAPPENGVVVSAALLAVDGVQKTLEIVQPAPPWQ